MKTIIAQMESVGSTDPVKSAVHWGENRGEQGWAWRPKDGVSIVLWLEHQTEYDFNLAVFFGINGEYFEANQVVPRTTFTLDPEVRVSFLGVPHVIAVREGVSFCLRHALWQNSVVHIQEDKKIRVESVLLNGGSALIPIPEEIWDRFFEKV